MQKCNSLRYKLLKIVISLLVTRYYPTLKTDSRARWKRRVLWSRQGRATHLPSSTSCVELLCDDLTVSVGAYSPFLVSPNDKVRCNATQG